MNVPRIGQLVVFVVVASGGAAALARPPYPAIFQEHYARNEPVVLAATAAKCNVCHEPPEKFPLAGGKPRNPYGMALGKYISGKDFSRLKKPEQRIELATAFKAALEKVEKEKSPDGTPFGEIIRTGKLPVPAAPAKEGEK